MNARLGNHSLIENVDDLRQIGRAYRTAAALGRIDKDRVDAHRRTLQALAAERAALEKKAHDMRALQTKAQQAKARLWAGYGTHHRPGAL